MVHIVHPARFQTLPPGAVKGFRGFRPLRQLPAPRPAAAVGASADRPSYEPAPRAAVWMRVAWHIPRLLAAPRAPPRAPPRARRRRLSASGGDLPPRPAFTALSSASAEELRAASLHFAACAGAEQRADRLLQLLREQRGQNVGCQVDLYEHGLQAATRALRDGADEELVVCALLHDVGELITPISHGEVAGALLRPFISPRSHWILEHHEIFQAAHYARGAAQREARDAREAFRDHEHFAACERFCARYDEVSFDPDYDTLPLEVFEPMVLRVVSREAFGRADHAGDAKTRAKQKLKATGAYPSDGA